MRSADWILCVPLCVLFGCHGDRPAPAADESTEGAEYVEEPIGEEDPLHPFDSYSQADLGASEMAGGTGGMGAMGGTGGMGGIGGMGGMGGRGDIIH